jgi:hypothetical protein
LYIAELTEVMIEGKGSAYTESLDDYFAGAIGKTPALVVVLLKNIPCFSDVAFG